MKQKLDIEKIKELETIAKELDADGVKNPLDYEALTLCMRKINHTFVGKKIGLPKIGSNLAGGDWNIIKEIIKKELKDCDVTVVIYNKD